MDPELEFAHTNLRKPNEATMEPQVLDPNPKKWRTEHTRAQKLGSEMKVRWKEAKGASFEHGASVRTC